MWFTSLRHSCHLIPSYVGISSMLSIAVYFAFYLDLKIFLGRSVGLLQATLFLSYLETPLNFYFMRDRVTYSHNSRNRKICDPFLAPSLTNVENLNLFLNLLVNKFTKSYGCWSRHFNGENIIRINKYITKYD